MLDHVFLPVSDLDRSIAFYTAALAPAGIMQRVIYDGKDGLQISSATTSGVEVSRHTRKRSSALAPLTSRPATKIASMRLTASAWRGPFCRFSG